MRTMNNKCHIKFYFQFYRLEGDINNNSEKIAIETDWREKGDDELNNKIDQVLNSFKTHIKAKR